MEVHKLDTFSIIFSIGDNFCYFKLLYQQYSFRKECFKMKEFVLLFSESRPQLAREAKNIFGRLASFSLAHLS